jgi:hypothetical protein
MYYVGQKFKIGSAALASYPYLVGKVGVVKKDTMGYYITVEFDNERGETLDTSFNLDNTDRQKKYPDIEKWLEPKKKLNLPEWL